MKRFFGFLSAMALIVGFGASAAHAEGFTIGGSFDGFAAWSHSDKNGPAKTRAQAFFTELPTVCSGANKSAPIIGAINAGGAPPIPPGNCRVNFANMVGGDTDFGAYETSLSLVGVGEINENADMVFRLGVHAPGAGDDVTGGGGVEVSLLVEQAYADFHNDGGDYGLIMGRLSPNVGTSLHMADRRTPFLSIARSNLLPSFLTGAMGYYNAGEISVAGYIYNDLNGQNNQTDLDLGYGLAAAYGTDEMDVRLQYFFSPEAVDAAAGSPLPAPFAYADPDNQSWVNVLNLHAGMTMDELSGYLDLTWRRDGYAGSVDPQAIAIGVGGEMSLTDLLAGGMHLEWVHGNNDAGRVSALSGGLINGAGGISGNLGVTNEDTIVFNPYIALDLADRTGIALGYNFEHTAVERGGDNNRNFHTVYAQVTAVLDSGAEPRSPILHPLN